MSSGYHRHPLQTPPNHHFHYQTNKIESNFADHFICSAPRAEYGRWFQQRYERELCFPYFGLTLFSGDLQYGYLETKSNPMTRQQCAFGHVPRAQVKHINQHMASANSQPETKASVWIELNWLTTVIQHELSLAYCQLSHQVRTLLIRSNDTRPLERTELDQLVFNNNSRVGTIATDQSTHRTVAKPTSLLIWHHYLSTLSFGVFQLITAQGLAVVV